MNPQTSLLGCLRFSCSYKRSVNVPALISSLRLLISNFKLAPEPKIDVHWRDLASAQSAAYAKAQLHGVLAAVRHSVHNSPGSILYLNNYYSEGTYATNCHLSSLRH